VLEAAEQFLKESFATYVFDSHSGLIEEAVHQAFIGREKNLLWLNRAQEEQLLLD